MQADGYALMPSTNGVPPERPPACISLGVIGHGVSTAVSRLSPPAPTAESCRSAIPRFLFLDDAAIPPMHHASEPALRMRTVYWKVTNGLRPAWGRDLFAAVNSGKH
jgi:hypothetical protein